jgi:hypothetical protein
MSCFGTSGSRRRFNPDQEVADDHARDHGMKVFNDPFTMIARRTRGILRETTPARATR